MFAREEGEVEMDIEESVLGFSSLSMIKLRGKVGDHKVLVLIDYETTLNFIYIMLVEKLNLNLMLLETTNSRVIMEKWGNNNGAWSMITEMMVEDLLLLDFGGVI